MTPRCVLARRFSHSRSAESSSQCRVFVQPTEAPLTNMIDRCWSRCRHCHIVGRVTVEGIITYVAAAAPRSKPPLQRLLSVFRQQLEDVWPEQAPLDNGTADQLGRLAARDVVGKYLWLSAAGELCDTSQAAARLGV